MNTHKAPLELSEQQRSEINDWLIKHNVVVLPCRWAREFSDAIPLVKILASLCPRLVIPKQYPSCNKIELKLANWDLLNRQVLTRIDIPLSKDELEKLSKGTPGAIDLLLFKIIQNQRQFKLARTWSRTSANRCKSDDLFDGSHPDYKIVNVMKLVNGEKKQVPQKMVSYELYREIENEIKEKSDRIANLKREEDRLQNLMDQAREAMEKIQESKAKDFLVLLLEFNDNLLQKCTSSR